MPMTNDIERLHGRIAELEARVASLEGVTDDGWITWNGGECPVGDGIRVDYKTRNGSGYIGRTGKNLRWYNMSDPLDIIAYRVVK